MTQSSPAQHQDDRRRARRVDVRGQIHSELESKAQPVTIRDLSTGGFLIESPNPFTAQAVHQFRVATRDGRWTTLLTARSVHSRPADPAEPGTYLTGFAFVQPTGEEAHWRVVELIDEVTSVVRFGGGTAPGR